MRTVPDIQLDIDQTEYQRDYLNARLSRLHSEMQDAMTAEVAAELRNYIIIIGQTNQQGITFDRERLEDVAFNIRQAGECQVAYVDHYGLRVLATDTVLAKIKSQVWGRP